jgi:hypothetical protein
MFHNTYSIQKGHPGDPGRVPQDLPNVTFTIEDRFPPSMGIPHDIYEQDARVLAEIITTLLPSETFDALLIRLQNAKAMRQSEPMEQQPSHDIADFMEEHGASAYLHQADQEDLNARDAREFFHHAPPETVGVVVVMPVENLEAIIRNLLQARDPSLHYRRDPLEFAHDALDEKDRLIDLALSFFPSDIVAKVDREDPYHERTTA